jgi:hypothetical protein
MGITHPADAHAIGVLAVGTDKQIVIPGKTEGGRLARERKQAGKNQQNTRGHGHSSFGKMTFPAINIKNATAAA